MSKKISSNEIIEIIENILEIESNTLNINTKKEDVEAWDSLGHLGVLVAIDKKLDGKAAKLNGLSEVDSIESIIDLLNENGLISIEVL